MTQNCEPVLGSWWCMAIHPRVVRRALMYAVVVGAILIAINHGDAILHRDLSAVRVFKMVLTTFVPYIVSTLSSVGAQRAVLRSDTGSRPNHVSDPHAEQV